jgi:hypothetical protein
MTTPNADSARLPWRCRLGFHRWRRGPFRVISAGPEPGSGIIGIAREYSCARCSAKDFR